MMEVPTRPLFFYLPTPILSLGLALKVMPQGV
jgi:hypothetical protein